MEKHILVVGSFVQDLTFATRRFPRPGETVVGEFLTGPGGKGSNQAVAARRAGADCTFIGAVGEDAFAASVRAFYKQEGIRAPLPVYADASTGTAGILFDESGQNEIVVALGANDRIRPGDIPDDAIRGADLVVCQLECNLDTVRDVLECARRFGRTTILNPAPLRDDLDPAFLDASDILIPNESEFHALLGIRGLDPGKPSEIASLPGEKLNDLCRQLGPPLVLVTLGEQGVHVSSPDSFFRLPAVPGIRAVDTTGAGDAFVGAFAAGYLRFGGDLEPAARFANTAAALSVTRRGTAPAMATRKEIEEMLSSQAQ